MDSDTIGIILFQTVLAIIAVPIVIYGIFWLLKFFNRRRRDHDQH
jgi:hypothetical protein